jgi:sorbitol-specific phosphotransferase system component IIBC
VWGLPVALGMAAGAFSAIEIDGNLNFVARPPAWAKVLAIVSFAVFVAFYAIALGIVPWLANEILALEVRAVGTALLTMVCCMFLLSSSAILSPSLCIPSVCGIFAFKKKKKKKNPHHDV